jgi:ABC-2 type transport system ATP-binding protein
MANVRSTMMEAPELSAPVAAEAQEVQRRFGRVVALHDASLSVRQAEFVALLGPNGSGKTTLLRLLAGVLEPNSGTVRVFGRPPREAAGALGYMAQSTALHPLLTTWENLRLIAGLQGVRSKAQMEQAIADVGLYADRHRPIDALGGGMQRRAALACTIVHRPRLLLLDEPTVGVDPTLRRSMWELLERMRGGGVTVVITTHIMEEAAACDRVAVLRDGAVVAVGEPAALMARCGAGSLEEAFMALTAGEAAA